VRFAEARSDVVTEDDDATAVLDDGAVQKWMLEPLPEKCPKRSVFLEDFEIARLLLPAGAFSPAEALLDELAAEVALDLADWGDRLVAAVLEARSVRAPGDRPRRYSVS